MTSVFDGMATVIGKVLGATVIHVDAFGVSHDLTGAIFRVGPVEIQDDDGRVVLLVVPSLSVQRPAADSIRRGDMINPGNGKIYRVETSQPGGSPAPDAFVTIELEEFADV
jgi:hypothetical protein